jgi:hypothetical protein
MHLWANKEVNVLGSLILYHTSKPKKIAEELLEVALLFFVAEFILDTKSFCVELSVKQ